MGDAAYHCKDPIDPSVAYALCDEAEQKGREWHAKGYHDRPDAQIASSLIFKEGLAHDSATNASGWANEERYQSTAGRQTSIVWTLCAADVADHGADQ